SVRACPPPRHDAPHRAAGTIDDVIERVTASPSNAGWIAAWNADHVYVSTDAGAHFDRVLDGPGAVSAVGFDCFGTVAVVRDEQLGLRVDGVERWQPVPGVELMAGEGDGREGHAAIVSGGPDLVVVGRVTDWRPRIARSADLGAHWSYADLDVDWETPVVHGRQREDGTIAIGLPSSDCAGDVEQQVTVRGGKVTSEPGMAWPAPGQGVDLDGERPAAMPADATWVGDGLAVAGDGLYRVRGPHVTRLPYVVEGDDYVADAAGRLWTVVCGKPTIASRQPSGLRCPDPDAGEAE
ncbi:MAG TPA: hypothetical protein VHE35_15930, partial [Kofleriaceae bacterium]|nr:hypothetical protein [Kofleriaceae bacterium]